jgi:hypothetical protein
MPSLRRLALVVGILVVAPLILFAQRGPGPVRIVMLIDSSTGVSQMIPHVRAGLKSFLDALPGEPEIALVSTGGQIRIRVPLTSDREVLHKAASAFAADGGGNSFLETMMEADRRFLNKGDNKRPVFVIVMSDGGYSRGEARIDEYNRWMNDFIDRGGRAHGIVVHGLMSGTTTDILMNLTSNSGGFYDSLNVPNPLAERMKALAELVAADML